MAKQPSDLVLSILKEIQSTLAQQGRRFDHVDPRFDGIGRRLEEIHAHTIASLRQMEYANHGR